MIPVYVLCRYSSSRWARRKTVCRAESAICGDSIATEQRAPVFAYVQYILAGCKLRIK